MVSTERVLAYSRLEPEASLESTPLSKPPPDWPRTGHIEMNDVCYRHSSDDQLVLKGISLNIRHGEKVNPIHTQYIQCFLAVCSTYQNNLLKTTGAMFSNSFWHL